jgi:hypothetical protein
MKCESDYRPTRDADCRGMNKGAGSAGAGSSGGQWSIRDGASEQGGLLTTESPTARASAGAGLASPCRGPSESGIVMAAETRNLAVTDAILNNLFFGLPGSEWGWRRANPCPRVPPHWVAASGILPKGQARSSTSPSRLPFQSTSTLSPSLLPTGFLRRYLLSCPLGALQHIPASEHCEPSSPPRGAS